MSQEHNPDFVREVQDALAHLYDYAYLERHPLADQLISAEARSQRTRAQETRRVLLDAIEELNPGDNVPIRALERRAYAVLFGLYVEGREAAAVASSLGIGERQLRRDRAAAVEALATILHDRYVLPHGVAAAEDHEETLRTESERFAYQRDRIHLPDLIDKLLPLLEGLAREQGVMITSHVDPTLPPLQENYTLLRQILLGLASQALANLPLTRLWFETETNETAVDIGVCLQYKVDCDIHHSTPAFATLDEELEAVKTMVSVLGGELVLDPVALWISLPRQAEQTLLVVDDKQELFELFQRYLIDQPYRLVHAAGVDQALALVRGQPPNMITLDLMMPNRDGWELLQILQSDPTTAAIPVIVCSVLAEPELAFSLGARGYLKKPVSAADLRRALAEWAPCVARGVHDAHDVPPRVPAVAAHPTAPAHTPTPR